MTTISRSDLQRFLKSSPDLRLVEVLPEESYRSFHIRGAINIPLDACFEERVLQVLPDKNQTIIVYSLNFECDLSNQAWKRMQILGYQNIFDYEPGKIDWNAARLPVDPGHPKLGPDAKQQRFLFL